MRIDLDRVEDLFPTIYVTLENFTIEILREGLAARSDF